MRWSKACAGALPGRVRASRVGAVAFIHVFGALLDPHVHFHCVVIEGVFEADGAGGARFHEARGVGPETIAEIQAQVRRRVLRAAARRGLFEREDAQAMGAWEHAGGFSVDASVRVEANDRQGLERLLRYCARPAFALERLREVDAQHLVYESVKPGPGGSVTLMLTPLELLDRLAALIPPPRRHSHRHFGVLVPNAPLRSAVTALADTGAETPATQTPAAAPAAPPHAPASASAETAQAAEEPFHRRAARYTWALLLARIYEVFPLLCPKCGSEMRIIAFITEAPSVREILAHLGEPTAPPRLAPARGSPLWDIPVAGQGECDPQAQPAPDYEFDQRIAWQEQFDEDPISLVGERSCRGSPRRPRRPPRRPTARLAL